MVVLEGIQSLPVQTFRTTDSVGGIIEITLRYRAGTRQWFIDVTSGTFTANNLRVHTAPNMMKQYEKLLSFGINVSIDDDSEPLLINDFSSGRVTLGILTPAEVEQINQEYQDNRI